MEQTDQHNAEKRSAGRHEESQSDGVDEGAQVKRVAQEAVRASCDDLIAPHGPVLHDGGVEIGRAPGAQRCRDESAEDSYDEDSDGGRLEGEPAAAGKPCGDPLPGADGVQMQPFVPRGGKAKGVDDGVDEEAETELEGGSFHWGARRGNPLRGFLSRVYKAARGLGLENNGSIDLSRARGGV